MYDEHHDHKIMKDCFKTTLLLQRTLYKIQSSTRALNNEQPNGKNKHMYCIRILTQNYGINHMDQCITK